jgi:ADP-ribose pyrophosphatase
VNLRYRFRFCAPTQFCTNGGNLEIDRAMTTESTLSNERTTSGAPETEPTLGGAVRLRTRRIYDGKIVALDVDEIVEPGGIRVVREVVRHSGSVAVLPVHDDGRVVLVRQYRYPVDALVWEVPAGRLDPGESPADAAARELVEETGLRAAEIEPLSIYFTTPGFCDETMHLFRAARLTSVPPRPEADERIETRAFNLDEARAMISRGEVRDSKTLIALLFEGERSRRKP